MYSALSNSSCAFKLYDINKCFSTIGRGKIPSSSSITSNPDTTRSFQLFWKIHLTFSKSMSLMEICNKFTYLCELITRKHFLNGNEGILPSYRLVRTSISTRIRPPCDANSRQIIPCFNELSSKYPKLIETYSFERQTILF